MIRRIFIGSSTAAFDVAETLFRELRQISGVEPVLWPEIFPTGAITFEAIEQESRKFAGAILIAAPDDTTIIKEREVKTARGNVILEIGYLAAILGRRRTMVAKYEETELPSDLKGVTYLPLGHYSQEQSHKDFSYDLRRKITQWVETLPYVPKDFSYVTVVHGYTGRWELRLIFAKWRGHLISENEYVEIRNMTMDIFVSPAHVGHGVMQGELLVNIRSCYARFHVVDSIRNIQVLQDGTLTFTSRAFARQRMELRGDPPKDLDGFEPQLIGVTDFSWRLIPSNDNDGSLNGEYITHSGKLVHSLAEVEARMVNAAT